MQWLCLRECHSIERCGGLDTVEKMGRRCRERTYEGIVQQTAESLKLLNTAEAPPNKQWLVFRPWLQLQSRIQIYAYLPDVPTYLLPTSAKLNMPAF